MKEERVKEFGYDPSDKGYWDQIPEDPIGRHFEVVKPTTSTQDGDQYYDRESGWIRSGSGMSVTIHSTLHRRPLKGRCFNPSTCSQCQKV